MFPQTHYSGAGPNSQRVKPKTIKIGIHSFHALAFSIEKRLCEDSIVCGKLSSVVRESKMQNKEITTFFGTSETFFFALR